MFKVIRPWKVSETCEETFGEAQIMQISYFTKSMNNDG